MSPHPFSPQGPFANSPPVVASTIVTAGSPSRATGCKVGIWLGAREPGETGIVPAEGFAAFSLFEIPFVPDFSSPRFPDLAQLDEAQRVKRVGDQQCQLISALHALGPMYGFSLRYFYTKAGPDCEGRIRLFLIGRCFDRTEAAAIDGIVRFREAVQRVFPAEYRLIDISAGDRDVVESALGLEGVTSISELLKPEQVLEAWHERSLCGFSFYYFPVPFVAAENDMVGFCNSLTSDQRQGWLVVDVNLVPTSPLTDVERMEIGRWGALCDRWGREQRIEVGGGLYSGPTSVEVAPDPHALESKKGFSELLQRYGSSQNRMFLYGIRAMWNRSEPPTQPLRALAARATSAASATQLRTVEQKDAAFQRALNAARLCYVSPAVCNERLWEHSDAPETIRRVHRMADLKEVAPFFRLPIPGHDGCPGLPLDTGLPNQTIHQISPRARRGPNVVIGNFVDGFRVTSDEAALDLTDLNKHMLIVGTPGSGKTNLCFSLLAQLWTEHHVPFLVLEPAKTEYRALKQLSAFADDLLVFTVGNERVSPFRFNPLQVPDDVSVSEHISSLNTCFGGAFDLWEPLPILIDGAIRECYSERGWSEYSVGGEEPELVSPTLTDLYSMALKLAERSSYRGETAGNIRGALETRLGSLLRGPKGRCFNTRQSLPTDLLMSRPVVLEMDALNDDEKALMMMFILSSIRAHARTSTRSSKRLSHIVLVEEAHNVIGRDDVSGAPSRANPKQVAIRFFTRMLAEMRALGEGIVIADQLPTAIAPEAIKNTNVKVMHRVVAAEDRQELGQSMVFDSAQYEQAAILPPGNSLVFMEGWAHSKFVSEPNFKDQFGVADPPSDGVLREQMEPFLSSPLARNAYLPYDACAAVCQTCRPRVREEMERWAEKKRASISSELSRQPASSRLAVALSEYMSGLDIAAEDQVRSHCSVVHFQERFGSSL